MKNIPRATLYFDGPGQSIWHPIHRATTEKFYTYISLKMEPASWLSTVNRMQFRLFDVVKKL